MTPALVAAAPPASGPASAPAEPEADQPTDTSTGPELEVERLLRAGEAAYQLGDFALSIQKFEAAYGLSPQPRLLYNLALSYLRRYDTTAAGNDLHRARALLANFGIELQRDPSLGDTDNLARLVRQVETKLVEHNQRADEREAAQRAKSLQDQAQALEAAEEACPVAPVDTAPDTSRGRTIGAAVMGVGSVSFAAGVASIAGFAIKGGEFKNRLAVLQAEHEANGCAGPTPPASCGTYEDAIAATTVNGRRANVLAGTIGGTLTALGAAGLIAGVVVFSKSDKRSRGQGAQAASVSVFPSVSGVVLAGRF